MASSRTGEGGEGKGGGREGRAIDVAVPEDREVGRKFSLASEGL